MVTFICETLKKNSDSQKQRVEKWLPGAGEWDKDGEVGKRIHFSVSRF